jgi:tetratricopeptide (TPR) repeat protein
MEEHFHEAETLARTLGDPHRLGRIANFMMLQRLLTGDYDEARSHAEEALALTRRLGARASEAYALCLAGDVASAGCAEDAEGYYREALARATELGMRPLVAHCHLGLGTLYRKTGKGAEAREHLNTAATMYREMGMTFWLENANAALGVER